MNTKPLILTADWLDQRGACPDQTDLATAEAAYQQARAGALADALGLP